MEFFCGNYGKYNYFLKLKKLTKPLHLPKCYGEWDNNQSNFYTDCSSCPVISCVCEGAVCTQNFGDGGGGLGDPGIGIY